jgi:hypothetical protein
MRLTKLAALAGMIGPLLFAGVVLALTLLQYDFMRGLGWHPINEPTLDWPSGLALGPYGVLMTFTFIVSGLLMALFALGLDRALAGTIVKRIGTALLLFAGIALMGLAFTTDPTHRTTLATWHGRLHDLSFVVLGAALLPAMLLLGMAFHHNLRWRRLGAYTFATAALSAPTFILKGIAFYIFLLAVLAWSEVTALRLYRLS